MPARAALFACMIARTTVFAAELLETVLATNIERERSEHLRRVIGGTLSCPSAGQ